MGKVNAPKTTRTKSLLANARTCNRLFGAKPDELYNQAIETAKQVPDLYKTRQLLLNLLQTITFLIITQQPINISPTPITLFGQWGATEKIAK